MNAVPLDPRFQLTNDTLVAEGDELVNSAKSVCFRAMAFWVGR